MEIFEDKDVVLSDSVSSDDDDVLTDEQPSKEQILDGKGEKVPALDTLNSYGEYGDFKLVGHGEITNEHCGHFYGFKGCNRVDLHDVYTIDGQNFKGKVFVRRVHHYCNKPSCPICFKHGWAVREAGSIEARCQQASKRFGQIEHIVASVPVQDYGLTKKQLAHKAVKILKELGVVGGVVIYHAFRFNVSRQWYFSPHFHVVGFVIDGYGRCRHCKRRRNCDPECSGFDSRRWKMYQKNKWYCKVLGERKTAFGTAWYQLNHASYDKTKKRFHIATWFGVCSYRKLLVTKEKRKELCPICQNELIRLKFLGKACVIRHKDDPDYCRDSYEDAFGSEGELLWVEKPRKKRKWNSGSSGDVKFDKERNCYVSPTMVKFNDAVNEMFPKVIYCYSCGQRIVGLDFLSIGRGKFVHARCLHGEAK